MRLCYFSAIFILILFIQVAESRRFVKVDPLLDFTSTTPTKDVFPYESFSQWGPGKSHDQIKSLLSEISLQQHKKFGTMINSSPFNVFPAANPSSDPSSPADITHYRLEESSASDHLILGNAWVLKNPIGRFTVQEPGNSPQQGCSNRTLSHVSSTSKYQKCVVSANAGFFDPFSSSTTFGKCLGNLIVDGKVVSDPGTQNANFGLLKNGSFVVGYIPMEMISRPDPENPDQTISDFEALVAGVVFLVRDGVNFVDESKLLEDSSTQTTGTLQQFIDVTSGRTAIGHDKDGNFILFSTDGKTGERGVNLYEMADLMISLGAVNAINLDGGGSVAVVRDDVVVNYPSDTCQSSKRFHCERKVSTIICLKDGITQDPPTNPPTVEPPTNSCPPVPPPQKPVHQPHQPPSRPNTGFQNLAPGWRTAIVFAIIFGVTATALLVLAILKMPRQKNPPAIDPSTLGLMQMESDM